MTTWINSQFPRPDFHRQVQRHYGLQDTGFPPGKNDELTPDFRCRYDYGGPVVARFWGQNRSANNSSSYSCRIAVEGGQLTGSGRIGQICSAICCQGPGPWATDTFM